MGQARKCGPSALVRVAQLRCAARPIIFLSLCSCPSLFLCYRLARAKTGQTDTIAARGADQTRPWAAIRLPKKQPALDARRRRGSVDSRGGKGGRTLARSTGCLQAAAIMSDREAPRSTLARAPRPRAEAPPLLHGCLPGWPPLRMALRCCCSAPLLGCALCWGPEQTATRPRCPVWV